MYDGLYLALAKGEGCEMVTGDKKLFNAVSPHIGRVRWVGDYGVEEETGEGEPSPSSGDG